MDWIPRAAMTAKLQHAAHTAYIRLFSLHAPLHPIFFWFYCCFIYFLLIHALVRLEIQRKPSTNDDHLFKASLQVYNNNPSVAPITDFKTCQPYNGSKEDVMAVSVLKNNLVLGQTMGLSIPQQNSLRKWTFPCEHQAPQHVAALLSTSWITRKTHSLIKLSHWVCNMTEKLPKLLFLSLWEHCHLH